MSVLFKKPDGTFVRVDEQYAQAAQQKGYVPATEEQVAASRQTGRAFAEGAGRGVTMGFLEPVATTIEANLTGRTEAAVAQDKKLRKEENPVASTAGEIAGVVGTSVATGGGASALVGGGVRGAALEGGLYGMGTMVSEAALENRPVTVDALASGLVGGAIAAGTAQAGLTVLGKGISAGVSKFGGKGVKDSLTKLADEAEWRALAESNKRWADKNEPFKKQILELGRREGILGKLDSALDKKTVEKAEGLAKGYVGKIQGQMDDLERFVPLKGNTAQRSDLVQYLEKRLDDEFGMNRGVYGSALKQAEGILQEIAEQPDHTWKTVWDVQSSLFKDLPRDAMGAPLPATAEVRETLRQAMRDYVFDVVGANTSLPQGLGASLRKTGQEAAAAMALAKAVRNRAQSIESSGGLLGLGSLKSLGAGAMFGLSTGNPLAAVAGAVAETQLRKRGGLFAGAALRSLSQSNVLGGVSKALSAHLKNVLAVGGDMLGAYRYPLAQAAAQGEEALLNAHLQIASSDQGHHYLASVGLPVENDAEVDAAGQRLAVLDALDTAGRESQRETEDAISALFGSAPGRKGALPETMSAKDLEKITQNIRTLLRSPEKAFEAVPQELLAGAPGVSSEAAAKILQAAQFLEGKMPKDPNADLPPSIKPVWQPSAEALDKFQRYREAVEAPAKAIRSMANGYSPPEYVEALQAVYPSLYAELQQKIGERLASHTKPLTYQQRLALSQWIGPTALGMTPQQVQVIQQSQTLAQGDKARQSGAGPKPDGRQAVNEEQIQTEAQKLEAR